MSTIILSRPSPASSLSENSNDADDDFSENDGNDGGGGESEEEEDDSDNNDDNDDVDMLSLRLNDSTQYFATLSASVKEIMDNVKLILLEHVQLVNKQLLPKWVAVANRDTAAFASTHLPPIHCFVIDRGLSTALHVFYMLLTHTRNLSMSTQYALQANFLYIEYIRYIYKNQLIERLTSYDAVQYVYKRTLYTMRADFVVATAATEPSHQRALLSQVDTWSRTYCTIIVFMYTHWAQELQTPDVSKKYCLLLQKLMNTINPFAFAHPKRGAVHGSANGNGPAQAEFQNTTADADADTYAQCLLELLRALTLLCKQNDPTTQRPRPKPGPSAWIDSPISFLEHLCDFAFKLVAKRNRTADQCRDIIRKMHNATTAAPPSATFCRERS